MTVIFFFFTNSLSFDDACSTHMHSGWRCICMPAWVICLSVFQFCQSCVILLSVCLRGPAASRLNVAARSSTTRTSRTRPPHTYARRSLYKRARACILIYGAKTFPTRTYSQIVHMSAIMHHSYLFRCVNFSRAYDEDWYLNVVGLPSYIMISCFFASLGRVPFTVSLYSRSYQI